jgi:uncharacterized membrane protein YeaQ/YmgE (transglycosylase-associated protein family)
MARKRKEVYSQKEKNLFWSALLIGFLGSFVGNITVGYLFAFSNSPTSINIAGAIIGTISILALIFYIKKQIKPILK